ncbi:MAG: phosphodiester glycosidase family protein [Anaerolineae bacterium]|nr:phosphodiester glycosidase family protein [Anaerolineae bacterium]
MRNACLLLMVGLLAGCTLAAWTPPPPTPTPTPVPTPDASGWELLAPGLEQRFYQPGGNLFGQLWALRIDPARYTFRAHYRPGAPLVVAGWQAELPEAVAFVNANFFSPDHTVLGLLVADGVAYGASYQGRGGTFQVQNSQPRVRSNIAEPYLGELLEQAVQAFPMLTLDGQPIYQPAGAQERISRRTVVAQDRQGRILLLVTPLAGLTLEALSAYLPETDMDIAHALNLDGGGSTLMLVRPPGSTSPLSLPSFDPVPAVLAVYAR